MSKVINKYGLGRYVSGPIRREIRQRSKFGCVICRVGFYDYEHIDPSFEDARRHESANMCCLCPSCHGAVTRGQLSKQLVRTKYQEIQAMSAEDAGDPIGPLDFHDGSAELLIGDLLYSPAVHTVVRYHGQNLITVEPGGPGLPGKISAIFTNPDGEVTLRLDNNQWVGATENWDIEVVGARITVRHAFGEKALQLRLDPPGRIVIEHLDMRIKDAHILATEKTYAAGRYLSDGTIGWVWAKVHIPSSTAMGVALEFTDTKSIEARGTHFQNSGQSLSTADGNFVLSSDAGIFVKSLGICVAGLCGHVHLYGFASNVRPLVQMRQVVFSQPEKIGMYIGIGRTF